MKVRRSAFSSQQAIRLVPTLAISAKFICLIIELIFVTVRYQFERLKPSYSGRLNIILWHSGSAVIDGATEPNNSKNEFASTDCGVTYASI